MDVVERSKLENNSCSNFELLSAVFVTILDPEILRHVDCFGEALSIYFSSRYPRKVIFTT
jgi:hypothetical protein